MSAAPVDRRALAAEAIRAELAERRAIVPCILRHCFGAAAARAAIRDALASGALVLAYRGGTGSPVYQAGDPALRPAGPDRA